MRPVLALLLQAAATAGARAETLAAKLDRSRWQELSLRYPPQRSSA